jgi:hypothetical protein
MDKTVEQLEAETKFLAEYLQEYHRTAGPNERWGNLYTTKLITWAFLGEEVLPHQMPWTPYEMAVVNRFIEHAPEHLKVVFQPMLDEFNEMVAVRQEKDARDAYLRTKQAAI